MELTLDVKWGAVIRRIDCVKNAVPQLISRVAKVLGTL